MTKKLTEFDKYRRVHGNVKKLSDALGITKGAVSQWKRVPVKQVPAVSEFTGISKHDLRPDFYDEMKS